MLTGGTASLIRLDASNAALHSEAYVILKKRWSEAPSAQAAKKNYAEENRLCFPLSISCMHSSLLHFEVNIPFKLL